MLKKHRLVATHTNSLYQESKPKSFISSFIYYYKNPNTSPSFPPSTIHHTITAFPPKQGIITTIYSIYSLSQFPYFHSLLFCFKTLVFPLNFALLVYICSFWFLTNLGYMKYLHMHNTQLPQVLEIAYCLWF